MQRLHREVTFAGVPLTNPSCFLAVAKYVLAPVLVVVGEKETMFAKRAARRLSKAIEGAKGVMVPGVGHAWNLEAPDLFTRTVRAWVTDAPLPQELVTL